MEARVFGEHVAELRRRLFLVVLALGLGATLGYFWRKYLISLISRPLGQPLFYSSPSGGLEFVVWICLAVGIILSLPVLIWQSIRFIDPALSKRISRRKITFVFLSSLVLAAGGIAFAYKVILPSSLHFFNEFNGSGVKPLISTQSYLMFVLNCLISFAIIFQLPLILLFINTIRRFPPKGLSRWRRHVIVGSLALALIAPFTYDPLSQLLMAMPIVVLYELSIYLVWISNRKYYRQIKKTAKAIPSDVLTRRRRLAQLDLAKARLQIEFRENP